MSREKSLIAELKQLNQTLSYEAIARELNVSLQSVYRWINEINAPSQLALDRIEVVLKKHQEILP